MFNLVHGVGGEDGVLATWLAHHGIPFVGSEATSSALAMDKYRSKLIFKALGLPVLPDVLIQSAADFTRLDDLTFPLCIKPNNQGSSVGVIRLNDQSDFEQAEAVLEAYGPLMAEPWAQGREYTVAWVDGVCFPVIGIMPQGDAFYDYHAKYQSSSTQYCIQVGSSDAIEHDLKAMTRRAVEGLGCRHWARADFIFDGDQPYLLEVNTIPGMTKTSLVPKAAAADGVSFDALVRKILSAAASPACRRLMKSWT